MKLRTIAIILALFIIAAAPAVCAEQLNASKTSVSLYLDYGKVLVDTKISFSDPAEGDISFKLPLDARAITMEVDGKTVDPVLEYNILSYDLVNATSLRYQYISEAFVDGDSLVADLAFPVDSDAASVRISLPEKAVLESRISSGVQLPPVLPTPSKLETDGRSIIIIWNLKDVKADDTFALMARFEFPADALLIVGISAAVVVLVLAAGLIIWKVKKKKRARASAPRSTHRPAHTSKQQNAPDITKHLKEEEEQVVNILRSREGQCEQGTLRVVTGFSKAYLSGLLKELEARKIVIKEKRGKKNLVLLKE